MAAFIAVIAFLFLFAVATELAANAGLIWPGLHFSLRVTWGFVAIDIVIVSVVAFIFRIREPRISNPRPFSPEAATPVSSRGGEGGRGPILQP